ncbi:MAG: ABC transporter ATP-binding protein [Cytophagaceae bacterium]
MKKKSKENKETIIEVQNVKKAFKNLEAVKSVSFNVYKGEFLALLGPNGAGKTTLIEMIEGLQKQDEGEITIAGKKWETDERFIHSILGISLQETKFIDKLTAKETLRMFGSFYNLPEERIEEILKIIRLNDKQDSYVVNLSGGQRQKLALGVALLNKPKVLLLDEPTTGLDPNARREIWEILNQLKRSESTSMILTTHYMEEAEYLCDRIIIMDKGKFIAEGRLNDLLAKYAKGDIISFSLNKKIKFNLKELTGLRKLQWEIPGTKGTAAVNRIEESLPHFFNILQMEDIKPLDIECRKMKLDDLFITLTGRKLHE